MKLPINIGETASFIFTAIEGKYTHVEYPYVEDVIQELCATEAEPTELEDLMSLVSQCSTIKQDITNQFVVIIILNHDPEYFLRSGKPIERLFELVYGIPTSVGRRRTVKVDDYDYDKELVQLDGIDTRIDELEKMIVAVASIRQIDSASAATILAHMFTRVIKIHYFADGNGRLARFLVQFLLSSWKRPMIALPKVRNNAAWKEAVGSALDGNLGLLRQEFSQRLER